MIARIVSPLGYGPANLPVIITKAYKTCITYLSSATSNQDGLRGPDSHLACIQRTPSCPLIFAPCVGASLTTEPTARHCHQVPYLGYAPTCGGVAIHIGIGGYTYRRHVGRHTRISIGDRGKTRATSEQARQQERRTTAHETSLNTWNQVRLGMNKCSAQRANFKYAP